MRSIPLFGVDRVSDVGWFIAAMNADRAVADGADRGGESFALAKVIDPRLHNEGFIQAARITCILEDAPAHGAVTEPDVAQFVDGLNEVVVILLVDVVVDQDADGAVGHLRLHRQLRDPIGRTEWA